MLNFYSRLRLINRSNNLDNYDYNFTAVSERVWLKEDAESVYDQQSLYKPEEAENEKYEWQKKYLELLTEQKNNTTAVQIIAAIEKELTGRYARPAWLREAKIRLQVRAGKFDLAEAERFIGIVVSDSATEIKPPSVERFNDVLQILREENRAAETIRLSENFFARMLAFGQFDQANFGGLARAFFNTGETGKALNVLRLMIEASDESNKEKALGEIAAIDAVKAKAIDSTRMFVTESVSTNLPEALKTAAEIAFEFQQIDAAIAYRRQLLETNPTDSLNKIELAEILIGKGETSEAQNILTRIITDKNSPRQAHWQARVLLNAEMPNAAFDAFSQYYNGLIGEKNGQNETAKCYFIISLIADKDVETSARQKLIKLYAITEKSFAALKLAEIDKSAKSDELLEILSETAEKVGEFSKSIEFENARTSANKKRISGLQKLEDEKNTRATDFKVDLENTRKL